MESSSTTAPGSAATADKPKPKDFSHYYSVTTAHRVPSAMKAYYKFFQIPGIGNLAGGKYTNCPFHKPAVDKVGYSETLV